MRHDVVSLFDKLTRSRALDVSDPDVIGEFSAMVAESLSDNHRNPALVHGHRTEALFSYVVGGLGGTRLLTQEDQGEVYSVDNVIAPDYRLILNDGTRMLVEVKNAYSNANERRFRLNEKYVQGLLRYAELNQSELRFAIYYARWGEWALLPIDAFTKTRKGTFEIDMVKAFARSEMASLGDYRVGTTPDIEVLIESHPTSLPAPPKATIPFRVKNVRFFCNGTELTDGLERKLAFYFVRFGRWQEAEEELVTKDDVVTGLRYVFSPTETLEGQEFYLLGSISTMISNAFAQLVTGNANVPAISIDAEPSELGVLIPEDFESESLPLIRLIQTPNYDVETNFPQA